MTNCSWHHKNNSISSSEDYFRLELLNKSVAPMWILDLTDDQNSPRHLTCDSLLNSDSEWKNIKFRTDLPQAWGSIFSWLSSLYCFSELGRVSIILTRPGLPPHYHRDIGVGDSSFVPYSHRQ